MSVFEDLRAALQRRSDAGEFPDFLYGPVKSIAESPDTYGDREEIVETLLMQVDEYETYAESGCCKTAFDSEDIKVTLKRLGYPGPVGSR
ncbi:hypothetical protein LGV61_04155 [Desulfurispirillum indicum]|uniref:Uncharacterized protein n=1 Tax=Desulfurispirillum indicum (strain ATCC BAA-1389 / DSM 22839 / S5) TaxID=653733 RepID=E6W323_DESIS|nr:hypothetical protein [Desulfurispirillum indicum]ADU65684.1 hypothetical protein Selin_0946 [Desulfurispirillum indicum S5]UCZ57477.1 hypothetical protein LGV61_04155 [Desulfurispirillum indicum]